jgi:hypothetical protein
MEIISALGGIGAAFGLSGSAGLNAYIPLLVVALASRLPAGDPLLRLGEPYDLLGNAWVIGALIVLLFIEMTVDKIPAVDTANDVIQTLVRPAAGAVLFAANANVITNISPILALMAGLILAGGVHVTKGVARPVVTAGTAGTGNWLVSLIEDLVAVGISILSVLLPLLAAIIVLALVLFLVIRYRRRQQRKWARTVQ